MIRSFRCKDTQTLFETGRSRRWSDIRRIVERKLIQLHATEALEDLASPPGNRLEALTGDRAGQHSIRGCASAGPIAGRRTSSWWIITEWQMRVS